MCELVLGFFPHSGVLIITHLFQVHPFPCRLRLLARVSASRFSRGCFCPGFCPTENDYRVN